MTACAQDAEPAKSGSPTGSESPRLGPVDFLIPLISALAETAAQLSRAADSMESLAKSNQALIQAMSEMDENSDDDTGGYTDLSQPARR